MNILPLGTKTTYGIVSAIHSKSGERSYFMVDKDKTVSLIPADLIREEDVLEGDKKDES